MALSFAANSLQLENWGFSAGDIAALAGAGTAAITWVTNNFKDKGLLEFMKTDVEDLLPRRGIIDPVALHNRWDVRLTLLKNGKPEIIEHHSRPVVENMNIFSWFMTIIVSAMDATLPSQAMKQAMSKFLFSLFAEHLDELDYLQRELPHHIQGWISAAIVRNITAKARRVWHQLLDKNQRLPGDIPTEETPEIVRFLVWLTGAKNNKDSKRFDTASSDVFGFAIILESIGLDSIQTISKTGIEDDFLESKLIVRFVPGALTTGCTTDNASQPTRSHKQHRYGMRIPLQCMEECVSIWPGTPDENNQRRLLFKDGLIASETLTIVDYLSTVRGESQAYILSDETYSSVGRTEDEIYRVVSECFPIPTPALIDTVSRVLGQNPDLHKQAYSGTFREIESDPELLSKFQTFVMGYYYGILRKFIDFSRLSTQEAYGSWKWFDTRLIRSVRTIISDYSGPSKKFSPETTTGLRNTYFTKEGILKLIGLLFTGAEESQLRALHSSAVGIHGKISVVANSLFGYTSFRTSETHFCLLDTDPTAIPSNANGVISSGVQDSTIRVPLMLRDEHLQDISRIDHWRREDFTSHIQPDWENDVQQCQVVFRWKGRIVGKLAPVTIDRVWATVTPKEPPQTLDEPASSKKAYVAELETLVENCPCPDFGSPDFSNNQPPILIPTRNLMKARTFLTAYYQMCGFSRIELSEPWPSIGWDPKRHDQSSDLPIVLYADYNSNNDLCTGKIVLLT